MSRKVRSKRSKIPAANAVAMRDGAGRPPLPANGVGTEIPSPSPSLEMVETTSSPRPSSSRPQAPVLNLSLAAGPPASSAQTAKPDDGGRDDGSVPPVDLDVGFFDATSTSTEASFEVETRDPLAAMKRTPAAAQRRAHLARYVTAAVGLASAVCVAALVKSSVARSHEALPSQRSSFAAQAAGATLPAQVNAAPTTAPAPSPLAVANSAPAAAAASAEGTAPAAEQPTLAPPTPAPPAGSLAKAEAPAEPAARQPVQVAAEAPRGAATPSPEVASPKPTETPLDPKAAAKDAARSKAQSRGALERGNVAGAIAAGERSVAIDPTDAEAWLILGAAYQQRGDAKNALRSFKACISQGNRGPKNECAAMLR